MPAISVARLLMEFLHGNLRQVLITIVESWENGPFSNIDCGGEL